ncbi:hypothetical protein NPIL_41391 [Nephila pilipes]|uniref:Uncharacterized protein n=1 Tax=Nephila pilipes TaxID=299642 RepID=A0A8X6Q8S7_NEPPI|nr:hypothetical protein NPIL_41391 [Nephila pilipes]
MCFKKKKPVGVIKLKFADSNESLRANKRFVIFRKEVPSLEFLAIDHQTNSSWKSAEEEVPEILCGKGECPSHPTPIPLQALLPSIDVQGSETMGRKAGVMTQTDCCDHHLFFIYPRTLAID